jgi:hypothetical protein
LTVDIPTYTRIICILTINSQDASWSHRLWFWVDNVFFSFRFIPVLPVFHNSTKAWNQLQVISSEKGKRVLRICIKAWFSLATQARVLISQWKKGRRKHKDQHFPLFLCMRSRYASENRFVFTCKISLAKTRLIYYCISYTSCRTYEALTFLFSHGYARWQDIANHRMFSVINEPFKNGKSHICILSFIDFCHCGLCFIYTVESRYLEHSRKTKKCSK